MRKSPTNLLPVLRQPQAMRGLDRWQEHVRRIVQRRKPSRKVEPQSVAKSA